MEDLDRTILEIESKWWRYAGAKEAAIREQTELGGTAFYQRLNHLIDHPPAELAAEFAPTIARLKRMRAERLRQRAGRRAS